MQVWVTRHGQTDLNRRHLMQGRTDAPLNARGLYQARAARLLLGEQEFDLVYASPLQRAIQTAAIIGDTQAVLTDPRLREQDFGRYELRPYWQVAPHMGAAWLFPDYFAAPPTVESYAAMVERTTSFVADLKESGAETVLIACHGAIMRFVCGALLETPNHLAGRWLPRSCAIRRFESLNGHFRELGRPGKE